MATINPYAGDVLEFPAGTPSSVITAYYNALMRNRALEAEQTPWYVDTVKGITNDVLNPYFKKIIEEPFLDYRKEFDTGQTIRQRQAEIDAMYSRDINMKTWEEEQATRQAGQLGEALGYYTDIANTPGPTQTYDTTTGGGVPAYGPYDDPYSVGTYVPEDQMERRPTSRTETDEFGEQIEVERDAENISAPEYSGRSNIFRVTPGEKPSTAEAMRLFSGKFPTEAGRLGKFFGPTITGGMVDADKQDKLKAEAERIRAQAEEAGSRVREREQLVGVREQNIAAQANQRNAGAERSLADVERLREVAKTAQGKNIIRQYIYDNLTTLQKDPERLQGLLALIEDAQIKETPGQRADRELTNIRNKPAGGKSTSQRQIDVHRIAVLAASEAAGSITDEERFELSGLLKAYKSEPQIIQMLRAMGLDESILGGRPSPQSGKPSPKKSGTVKVEITSGSRKGQTVEIPTHLFDPKVMKKIE